MSSTTSLTKKWENLLASDGILYKFCTHIYHKSEAVIDNDFHLI